MNVSRLREAYYFIAAQPVDQVDLQCFSFRPSGGPVCGCALGLLAASEHFGLTLDAGGYPRIGKNRSLQAAQVVFDINQHQAVELFSSVQKNDAPASSDKEVFLNRMEAFLPKYGHTLYDTLDAAVAEPVCNVL